MAPLSPRKTAVAAGVTEQGTAVLERAAQVLALGGRFSAWKMLVQVNAADTCISARYIFCWSNSKDECLDPRLRPARLDKPIYLRRRVPLWKFIFVWRTHIVFPDIIKKYYLRTFVYIWYEGDKISFVFYSTGLSRLKSRIRRYDIRYCSLIHYCSIFKRLNNTKVWWYEWSILFCK